MPASILQLVAVGTADVYLTSAPQLDFFVSVYRRYHNFSSEHIPLQFDGSVDFGTTTTAQIPINGDLLKDLYLFITLPALTATSGTYAGWTNSIARALIKKVELRFNGFSFKPLYDVFLDIYDDLTTDASDADGVKLMLGTFDLPDSLKTNATGTTTYHSRLPFWFTQQLANALPMIAMQKTKVELYIEFRNFSECVVFDGTTPPSTVHITDIVLYGDYIFLEDSQRAKWANPHETEEKITLDPETKRLIKVEVEKLDPETGEPIPKPLLYLMKELQFTGEVIIKAGQATFTADLSGFNLPCSEIIFAFRESASETNNDWFNYSRRADNKPLITTAQLFIDAQPRFKVKTEDFFRLYQTLIHHTHTTTRYIYTYAFGQQVEKHQPSGTLNFSHIDSVTLQFTMNSGNPQCGFLCGAVNYNIFVVSGGLVGLAWST